MNKNQLTKFATMLLLCFSLSNASAQKKFYHSVGFSGLVGQPAIAYTPRFNIMAIGDNGNALSIGTNFGLAIPGLNLSAGGGASSSSDIFIIDLPILAELNIGHAASEDSDYDKKFGFHVGAGVDVSLIDFYLNYGLAASGGVRFKVGNYGSYGVRFGYVYSFRMLEDYNGDMVRANFASISLLFNLGFNED